MQDAVLIVARIGVGETEEWLAAAAERLTAAELAAAERSAAPVRIRHMIGRAVLRLLAAGALEARDPREVTVAESAEGRPYLPDLPELGVSVAHSDSAVVVAACKGSDVGVDVESLARQTADVQNLAARVFTAAESARLARLEPAAAGVEFIRHWIIKEAVGKALGVGYVPALRGAEIEPADPDGTVHPPLRLRSVWAGPPAERWTLHCIDLRDGDEQVAVAIAAPDVPLRTPVRIAPRDLRPENFSLGF